jgi:hypothetical protein
VEGFSLCFLLILSRFAHINPLKLLETTLKETAIPKSSSKSEIKHLRLGICFFLQKFG